MREGDLAFLDREALDGHFSTRPAAVQGVVRRLKDGRLADEADAWDAVVRDGSPSGRATAFPAARRKTGCDPVRT